MPTTSWRDNVAQQDQDDLDELLDICLDNATTQLSNSGTMRPFAATVDTAAVVTAVIASDQSVINFARENDVEVHISTQLNVSNFVNGL